MLDIYIDGIHLVGAVIGLFLAVKARMFFDSVALALVGLHFVLRLCGGPLAVAYLLLVLGIAIWVWRGKSSRYFLNYLRRGHIHKTG